LESTAARVSALRQAHLQHHFDVGLDARAFPVHLGFSSNEVPERDLDVDCWAKRVAELVGVRAR
jgi:hypothetical protein